MFRNLMLAAAAFCLAIGPAAAAESATLLGVFDNWSAYSAGDGASKTCYILSKPTASQPRGAKRGPIFLMVSDWPARKVKAEPQIVLGYPAREGGPASLGIGSDKFSFFLRNVNKDGSGWLQSLGDNPKLIDSMRGGVTAVAKALSQRGTHTTDTYSLAGFSNALDKAHSACGM
ncbi:MAG: hypothetical protein BGN85_01855 [Alphaproteobacteria bacterium 64-11]|nr:Invasion associated locus B family protein [Alphaproteobacteria bacterium]OJU09776.1 MAG: hypothetical protein BGN85_01855 [Alphaproteobacteria bacterium 64-11]